jgi:membrane associated rhomboid family serine protease
MFPLKDTIPSRSFPIVNWMLIGLNIVVFLGELKANSRGILEALVFAFGVIPARFAIYHDAHELATLFTSMFMHGGWMHLLSNMLALYIFGDNIEDRMGSAKYLIFYLLCGLAAGLTHIYFNINSTMPSIGASGAIAGVLGAYLLLFPRSRVITLIPIFILPFFVEIPAIVYLGFWFVSQLFNGAMQIVQSAYTADAMETGGVAWWAHIGGFVAGMLLVWVFAAPEQKPRKSFVDEYYPW